MFPRDPNGIHPLGVSLRLVLLHELLRSFWFWFLGRIFGDVFCFPIGCVCILGGRFPVLGGYVLFLDGCVLSTGGNNNHAILVGWLVNVGCWDTLRIPTIGWLHNAGGWDKLSISFTGDDFARGWHRRWG